MKRALAEVSRVLKSPRGRPLIVELGKPDNALLRWMVGIYWKYFAGFLTFLFLGRPGLLFATLHTTYRKLPKNSELRGVLEERFERVDFSTRMSGGAVIAVAEGLKKLSEARQIEVTS